MRHAAHKARNAQRNAVVVRMGHTRAMRDAHTAAAVEANAPMAALVPEVARMLNEAAPNTRRAIRQAARQRAHKKQFVTAGSLALLAATASSFVYASNNVSREVTPLADKAETSVIAKADAVAASDVSTQENGDGVMVSRSEERGVPAETTVADTSADWSISSAADTIDTSQMSKSLAANPHVAKLMDRDAGSIPEGFNPNHASGDTGNAYAFSQCTWWAYTRRQQLGLPVGSYFGNGADWANSAKELGYWVDNTPRVGDIMVFQRGQEGASSAYGHVAIVEAIKDGKVITSECGATYNGKSFSRTFSNVSDFQYIHY
ncbi:CHAP domain-containing protein [Bifidobacterium simiarum]|uniref:CHAP domain-containing protein n=1 Tax=Bifidobacterium simiarum TaxID=2045441 RepID=A0A2M9HDF4_9BIFI|nr:CHAP domain-containing protein [Bifidobacterium simiarum]MBT1167212.1 CHAP domain-containing protein [Bifidobacterium simiarum]PJM74821.1 CHAP domain-containing protein [Bifidobacterium simiarum]